MGVLEDKANAISADMEKSKIEKRVAFDPMMIVTIIGIIVNVIKIYQNCRNTPKEAAASMRSGGILERWRLRKAIRHQINDAEMHDHIGPQLFNSTLLVASKLQDEEVEKMYDEVKKLGG